MNEGRGRSVVELCICLGDAVQQQGKDKCDVCCFKLIWKRDMQKTRGEMGISRGSD